jgi:regulator of protease activity HflC (stomatin/prohibitin superfamily)
MDRNLQRIGLINLVTLLLVGIAGEFVARLSGAATAQVCVVYLGFGVLVAAVSCFQMRLLARECIEQMELAELKKSSTGSALFESQEAELSPARHSRVQFDRFFVPGFTIVLFLLQGGAAFGLWKWVGKAGAPVVSQATITMALMALFALILFLLGKYSAGIARLEGQRLLQPGASAMLLGSVGCLLVAAVEVAVWFGFPKVDRWIAWGLAVVLGLVALETLISLVLEIYRPRIKGQVSRLLYESRLVGLLGQPGGLITTAAQALDYQFGFKVSETWFYQFLEKALAWIIVLQLAVLFASTSIVIVKPQEQALLERLGRPVAGRAVLEPGLHFKWPWPIDKAYLYPTREVHTFYVGFMPDKESDKERTLLWTRKHFKEELSLLVASRESVAPSGIEAGAAADRAVPVNLLSVNIPIQYRIHDLTNWVYQHADAAELLSKIANREMVRYLVHVDIEDIMAAGRLRAASELRQRIQAQADRSQLGVEILFVGLQGIHPPVEVAPAYEELNGAIQEKETTRLVAQAYATNKVPLAMADAQTLITQAESEGLTRTLTAAAAAGQFKNQLTAFQASPSVYMQRTYLETFVRAITPARKYIIATTNTQESLWFNLEDKLNIDEMDIKRPVAPK